MGFFKKIRHPKKSLKKIANSFKGGNFLDPVSTISGELDPGVALTHKLFRKATGQDLDPASKVNQNLSRALGTDGNGFLGNKPATALGAIFTGAGFAAGAGGAGAAGGAGSTAGGAGTAGGTGTAAGAGTAGAGGAGGVLGGMSYGDIARLGAGVVGPTLDYLGNRDATRAETEASRAAIDELRRQYDTTRGDLMPWLDDGRNALAEMRDPNAFRTSPGYDFRRREGLQGVQGSAAAAGGLYSGNTLKAITEFGDNLAEDEFANYWNRLASRAGIGQTTATNLGQIGSGNARDIGSLLQDVGSSRASGIRGRYGAIGSGAGAIAGGLDNYFAGTRKINPRSIYDYSTMNGGGYYA
jgi:hypothetical protein